MAKERGIEVAITRMSKGTGIEVVKVKERLYLSFFPVVSNFRSFAHSHFHYFAILFSLYRFFVLRSKGAIMSRHGTMVFKVSVLSPRT